MNQEIDRALLSAFKQALSALEYKWKQHPHYLHLQRKSSSDAQKTLMPFRWLRDDATQIFQRPEYLAHMLQQPKESALLHQDEDDVRLYIANILDQYLYGHDDELVTFVKKQLADEWLQQFYIILHPTGCATRERFLSEAAPKGMVFARAACFSIFGERFEKRTLGALKHGMLALLICEEECRC